MLPWLREGYGNPSSAYAMGKAAADAIATARGQIAELLGCSDSEIIFTSCGTESINTAMLSACAADPDRTHVVTSAVEHSATMKLCDHLAQRGYAITRLPVDGAGLLDTERLESAIDPETAVVSLLWANNETGVLFPVGEIAEVCRRKRVLLHMDAVQAVGKVPIRLDGSGIHTLSLSGHKLHAPKGVGALFVSRRSRFTPLLRGSQERGRRGGTENVASIVGFGKAAELASTGMRENMERIRRLRDRFEEEILAAVPGATLNGDREARLPNTSNISFQGVESEGALMLLDMQGICCSAGSACTTGSVHASHVLKAMGLSNDAARSSLRFSFGRLNTDQDVDQGLEHIPKIIARLREMSPAGSPVITA